ncbi:MAG: hypothetical protein IJ357_03965 [Oscillospiraceae bacterium]|nr:hypothetical protein [Oscillospiraceae bacterium]
MNNEANKPSQISLFLRLLGGGYLVYLAWDLRGAIHDSPLFLIAVIVFGVVGAALLIHTILKFVRHEYIRNDPAPESENTEDCEERSVD